MMGDSVLRVPNCVPADPLQAAVNQRQHRPRLLRVEPGPRVTAACHVDRRCVGEYPPLPRIVVPRRFEITRPAAPGSEPGIAVDAHVSLKIEPPDAFLVLGRGYHLAVA